MLLYDFKHKHNYHMLYSITLSHTIITITYLVGGFNHLEKYELVNGKNYPMHYGTYGTYSKPPTRLSKINQVFV